MAKITLVNPKLATVPWQTPLISEKPETTLIRHGLAFLSAALKKYGHQVTLIDLRLLGGWDEYEKQLIKSAPDFIGVTMHTCEFNLAIECCRRAKKINPGYRTVVGGIHPTMFPQECRATGVVDFVLQGEGEISFPALCNTPEKFPPVFRGETPDLDALPFEDRALWPDYEKRIQHSLFFLQPPLVDMLAHRGCPWQCRFCCGPGEQNLYTKQSTTGKRIPYIRGRSVPNVIKELKELHERYHFKSIVFHDDQFVINPKWAKEFCQAMIDAKFPEKGIKWWAAVRADVICKHPELIEEMKKAGLYVISIGFESFSDRMLKWLNKGTSAEINRSAAEICKKLGLKIYANFILGIPYQDGKWYPEDDIITLKAIRDIKPEIRSCSFFSAMPGSSFYQWCLENNLILDLDPTSSGTRFADQARIKGVDYKFLNNQINFYLESRFNYLLKRSLKQLGVYEYILPYYHRMKQILLNVGK